jgi:flagellar assembly protein FliH
VRESIYRSDEAAAAPNPFRLQPPPPPRLAPEEEAAKIRLERDAFHRVARQARGLQEKTRAEGGRLLAGARADAERIVAGARVEAAAIVEEGRRNLAALEAASHAQGEREGFEAGLARGAEAAEAVVARLEAAFAEARGARRRFLDSAAAGAVDVVMDVARRVVRREARIDRGLVVRLVEAAVEKVRNAERVTVRVNLDDLGAAEAIRDRVLARLRSAEGVEVRPDPSVEKGGAIVDTEFGRVDARIASQLDELERALRSVEAAPADFGPDGPASAPTVE